MSKKSSVRSSYSTRTTKLTTLQSKHSQSALEYMMTYGWAILIIVIVAAGLYSLGIFSPTNSASTSITGFSGLGSVQAECLTNGALAISIGNSLATALNITKINTTDYYGKSESTNFSVEVYPNNQVNLLLRQGSCSNTSSDSISVTISYTEPNQVFYGPYQTGGKVKTASAPISSTFSQNVVAGFNNAINSHILVRSSSSLNITNSMTIVAWFKLSAPIGSYNEILVWKCETTFQGETGPSGGYNLMLGYGSDYEFEDGPQNSSGWLPEGLGQTYYGTWIQVVSEKTGATNNISLYTDGIYKTSDGSAKWPLTDSPANLTIGVDNGFVAGMNGSIANVQIYNTPLSSSQISQLYSEGIGGAPIPNAGLASWWPLDGNANDYSGNNNNGVATNVNWVPP